MGGDGAMDADGMSSVPSDFSGCQLFNWHECCQRL